MYILSKIMSSPHAPSGAFVEVTIHILLVWVQIQEQYSSLGRTIVLYTTSPLTVVDICSETAKEILASDLQLH